jgi:hypothetical protein
MCSAALGLPGNASDSGSGTSDADSSDDDGVRRMDLHQAMKIVSEARNAYFPRRGVVDCFPVMLCDAIQLTGPASLTRRVAVWLGGDIWPTTVCVGASP